MLPIANKFIGFRRSVLLCIQIGSISHKKILKFSKVIFFKGINSTSYIFFFFHQNHCKQFLVHNASGNMLCLFGVCCTQYKRNCGSSLSRSGCSILFIGIIYPNDFVEFSQESQIFSACFAFSINFIGNWLDESTCLYQYDLFEPMNNFLYFQVFQSYFISYCKIFRIHQVKNRYPGLSFRYSLVLLSAHLKESHLCYRQKIT